MTIPVKFGKATLWCEVARTDADRERGLMFRDSLGADRGMLFVFDSPHLANFWMKNTRIPLSIAFLDPRKHVLNLDRMQPFDERSQHPSKGDALYAVEANDGWFEAHAVKPGDAVVFEE